MNRLNQQRNRILEDISRYRQIMNYITEQQQGEVNYTIQQLQQLLNSKGFNVGKDDGIFGTNTLNGILKALNSTSTVTAQAATVNPQTKTDYTNTQTNVDTSTNPEPVKKDTSGSGAETAKTPINSAAAGASAVGSARRVNLKPGQTNYAN